MSKPDNRSQISLNKAVQMQSTTIHLPGSGQPNVMFAFDPSAPALRQPMNLQPLSRNPRTEQWLAPGASDSTSNEAFCTVTTPYYQLRTLIVEAPIDKIRQVAEEAYRVLLADIIDSSHPQLTRFWNYLPQINVGAGDNEVYRQFCWGRAEAFEAHAVALPAATAIGSHDNQLRITALSSTSDTRVQHIENPRQVSAYKYPKEYGPRSPSFARATWVEREATGVLLLSGTSSIVEHNTLHSGNLTAQVAETKRNVDHLIQYFTTQVDNVDKQLQPIAMRFYLRDPADQALAEEAYTQHFEGYPAANFFIADICREDLSMEIEGVFAPNTPT